jgi:molecular chaperone GrpE
MRSSDDINNQIGDNFENNPEENDMTNLQDKADKLSDKSLEDDKMAEDSTEKKEDENNAEDSENAVSEPSLEEKYALLNDSYLRLMAEYDNYRKRTIREKADLIKGGGESVLKNILPVVDDFERALETVKKSDNMTSIVEGVQLIHDKFISYLLQQGVKKMETVGMPFDSDMYEAIATAPVVEEDKKGKVIDCVQVGYTMYDKVIRFAKVVVGA